MVVFLEINQVSQRTGIISFLRICLWKFDLLVKKGRGSIKKGADGAAAASFLLLSFCSNKSACKSFGYAITRSPKLIPKTFPENWNSSKNLCRLVLVLPAAQLRYFASSASKGIYQQNVMYGWIWAKTFSIFFFQSFVVGTLAQQEETVMYLEIQI